jgi:hypothetical protein
MSQNNTPRTDETGTAKARVESEAPPAQGPAPANDTGAPPAAAPDEKQTLTFRETFSAVRRHLSQEEGWKRLNWFERTKLSAAYTVGVLASSVMRDMGDHAILGAVAVLPGPGGTVIGAGLLLSYLFRWDARGKEVRGKFIDLWKKGVPLADYEDVIRQSPVNPQELDVDTGKLIAKKGTLLKDEFIDSNKRVLIKVGGVYIAVRDFTGTHTGNAAQTVLSPVVGKENAEKFVKDAGTGYQSGERAVGSAFNWAAGHATTVKDWTFAGVKHAWNASTGLLSRLTGGKTPRDDDKPPPPAP